jgi:single-stranded DNA-binding protein
MSLQHRNDYYFSGAIKKIFPVSIRPYQNKDGETIEWKERVIVVTNKYSRGGYWVVSDAVFTCTGKSLEALELMHPGLEVIVSFSIKARSWTSPNGEEKWFTTNYAYNIMSPTDKIVTDKWWSYADRQKSNKGSSKEESPRPLTEQERQRQNPEDKEYNAETYSRTVDYSDGKPEIQKTKSKYAPKPQSDDDEGDLPF